MSVIDDVRTDREDLARVLKKHAGIRRIVEDLYPDSAHFIYELLQNAEDAGARTATFALSADRLVFEHEGGRAFEPRDVAGITDIGEGTKAGDDEKIGRFGVGFKAVFAYSETPSIWSPTFSFKITELVLPHEIPARAGLGQKTRFEFPFNNPKKAADVAEAEIRAGLDELAETTLLFLSNLESVTWTHGGTASGEVRRTRHAGDHVEVVKQTGDRTESSHYLMFKAPVDDLPQQSVAVAFSLELLPDRSGFDAEMPLHEQMRLAAALPGRVAVYFPAAKETSGLRFHVHAPFVPELSRASIKDTPANAPLFAQIGALAAASLHKIRDYRLLTLDCLSVLPNDQDELPPRYQGIREALIAEMNDTPLTPTAARGFAPAKHLLQGKAALKDLLSNEDVEYLVDYEDVAPAWAIGSPQKNSRVDRFLTSLAVRDWDVEQFASLIQERANPGWRYVNGRVLNEVDAEFMAWLKAKDATWHQELYGLLYSDYLAASDAHSSQRVNAFKALKIARLTDGTHAKGTECYFTDESGDDDALLPRVDPAVYSTGRRKAQQDAAKKFLETIGVRLVGEGDQIDAILRRRYASSTEGPTARTHRQDLKRFVDFLEENPNDHSRFRGAYLFEGPAGRWHKPDTLFVDAPLVGTGLAAYHLALGTSSPRVAVSDRYADVGVSLKRLVPFLEKVGVQSRLLVGSASCWKNPAAATFVHTAGGTRTSYAVDSDYAIPGLEKALRPPSAVVSRLIWHTLVDHQGSDWTTAKYRNNGSYPLRTSPSQLAITLSEMSWVPQKGGLFVKPSDASAGQLLEGFPFDPGWPWLQAIGFGREAKQRTERAREEAQIAKDLGFSDRESLERAQRFASLPPDEQVRVLQSYDEPALDALPDKEPADKPRRAKRVRVEASNATERRTEQRSRAVSVGLDAVKEQAGEYLRELYTGADGEMICQVCKRALPFTLADGTPYFERVELFEELKKHYRENYVALCPNHAAMFQHANESRGVLLDRLERMSGHLLAVTLGQKEMSIYFTKTHAFDLSVVVREDRGDDGSEQSESPDEEE